MKNAPTLEDFCEAANDLYAAPTEERFYVVVNLARDVIQTNQAKWDDGYKFGRSEVEKLRQPALLALGLLWMTGRQNAKVHLAYITLRDALGGKEALRQGIQAAMDAGQEADHPPDVDWWAGKDRAAALRAENERLRADAERYRWLTADHPEHETRETVWRIAGKITVRGKGATDAAIDAARGAGEGVAGVKGTGSATNYTTNQFSHMGNQAHGFGAAGVAPNEGGERG